MSTLKTTNLQHASAASPAIVLASDGTATAQLSSINGGPLAGARNRIINGDMRISQRGTSFTSTALNATTYTLDRWATGGGGTTAVGTITQSTDTPNSTFPYSFKLDVTTADASVAATDRSHIVQQIEGHNVVDLIGQTFTLSFWVKSPKTGTHCVSFQNSGSDRSYVTEYTVSVANTWEYKTVAVTGGLITAGTWDFANGSGLKILFALMVGSTYQGTAGSWLTGNFQGTSSQVNVLDNTANDFFLCGVQLEAGSVATPFERRSYGQELALCQRYYWRHTTSNDYEYFAVGRHETTGVAYVAVEHPVTMRDTPTVFDAAAASNFFIQAITPSSVAIDVQGARQSSLALTFSGGPGNGQAALLVTRPGSYTAFLGFGAEL